ASGTGNMKLAMNGALTIGTLDGANVEIRGAVGAERFFLFGMTAEEVGDLRASGYRPRECYESQTLLREVIDLVAEGVFSRGDRELFRPLVDNLLEHDHYLVLADFADYAAAQERVAVAYANPDGRNRDHVLTVPRIGEFSSDRAIRDYARYIWHVGPVEVPV